MGQQLLGFGQPIGGIMQIAYVVPDIQAAMARWTADLGVGPWFLLDRFTGDDPIYRGEPCLAGVALAMGFSGHMQYELIEPTDDHPSVYKEHIDAKGYGFHHYGLASVDYAIDKARYLAAGYELAFECGVPTGGTVGYLDTNGVLPGYLEVIEVGDVMDEVFTRFWQASIGWDGADPVRPFG
jgi:glyoxalase/bleomycin resistance protein/dioxygenase superfamily protein